MGKTNEDLLCDCSRWGSAGYVGPGRRMTFVRSPSCAPQQIQLKPVGRLSSLCSRCTRSDGMQLSGGVRQEYVVQPPDRLDRGQLRWRWPLKDTVPHWLFPPFPRERPSDYSHSFRTGCRPKSAFPSTPANATRLAGHRATRLWRLSHATRS